MSVNDPTSRRAFLRKAATTTAVTGLGAASIDTAAAAKSQTAHIYGESGGADYEIFVNDSSPVLEKTESTESLRTSTSNSALEGTVPEGDEDVIKFDGHVTAMWVDGFASVEVDNPRSFGSGELSFDGSGGSYHMEVVNDITDKSDLESDDSWSGNTCEGTASDKDYYYADGGVSFLWLEGTYTQFNYDV